MLLRSKRKATSQPNVSTALPAASSASSSTIANGDEWSSVFLRTFESGSQSSSSSSALPSESDSYPSPSSSSSLVNAAAYESSSSAAASDVNENPNANDASNKRIKIDQSSQSSTSRESLLSILQLASSFVEPSASSTSNPTDLRIIRRNHLSQLAAVEIQHIMCMLDTLSLLMLIRTSKGRLRTDALHPLVWKRRHFSLYLSIFEPQFKVHYLNQFAYLPFCNLSLKVDFRVPQPNDLLAPSTIAALYLNLIAAAIALPRVDQLKIVGTSSKNLTSESMQTFITNLVASQRLRLCAIDWRDDDILPYILPSLVQSTTAPIHRLGIEGRNFLTFHGGKLFPRTLEPRSAPSLAGLSVFIDQGW